MSQPPDPPPPIKQVIAMLQGQAAAYVKRLAAQKLRDWAERIEKKGEE